MIRTRYRETVVSSRSSMPRRRLRAAPSALPPRRAEREDEPQRQTECAETNSIVSQLRITVPQNTMTPLTDANSAAPSSAYCSQTTETVMHEIKAVGVGRKAIESDERLRPKRRLEAMTKKQPPAQASTKHKSAAMSMDDRRRTVQGQRGHAHPEKQRSDRDREPQLPAPSERAVGSDKTDIDAGGADADAGEKVDAIKQRSAPLHGEDSGIGPVPRRECERQRHIGDRGDREERGKVNGGTPAGRGATSGPSAATAPARSN